MRRRHNSAQRWRRGGFTLLEVMISMLIFGTALVILSSVISRDMSNGVRNSFDEIGQAAATRLAERYAFYEGFNVLNTELQNNPPVQSYPRVVHITVSQPTDPPDLAYVPWRRAHRWIERYNGNPDMLRLTVVVDIANSAAAGDAGQFRSWTVVTLVPKEGFDKST